MITERVDLTTSDIQYLKTLIGERLSTNHSVMDQHGRDESAYPPIMPAAVAYPANTDEVSKILAYCNEKRIPVIPFGAGTSLEGHVLPIFGGLSLDLTGMKKIIKVSPEDLLVIVEPGVHRMELNTTLANYGLFFSVDPGADATLGGMAATGAAGTTTVKYGSMRENVLALTAVLADGSVIKVGRPTRKLSAGYDLTRLIIGSEGTLAVITELTLKIYGIPEKMAAASVCFENLADGVKAASVVVQMGLNVARCEFMDVVSIGNVNRHSGLNLPEIPTLFFEFHGSAVSVAEDAKTVAEVVKEFNGSDFQWSVDESARRKLWQARHDAYWAGLHSNPGKRIISTDMAVPVSQLAQAVGECEKILASHRFPYAILGHVADGNFHCMIVTDPAHPEELSEIRAMTQEMTSIIIGMNGTCTGEHGIGLGKISSLVEETGSGAVQVMRQIKATMDPNNILNPGKIFAQI
jgi:D-lactate dehydrogenase (cytochrome)